MSQLDMSFDEPAPNQPRVLTVAELVRAANRFLERKFSNLWVEGEVSSLRIIASGHAFFSLKDDYAVLPIAMWRSTLERLAFDVADGQNLRLYGRLAIFEKQGKLQFYADRAEPAGLGALMLQLEQLKARLSAEGLFDPDRKRALPAWPRTIGVVTSSTGAAIHDILKVARRRCPSRVLLAPALVQGPEAASSLRRALERLQREPGVDVIIVGRGGGSMEDLWAFNDERWVRAIADCPVPVVSGVGHEVDVTLSDLAADVRAATPSHAAELVVPDRRAVVGSLSDLRHRLARAVERGVLDHRSRFDLLQHRLEAAAGSLASRRRRVLGDLYSRLRDQHPQARIARDRRRLEASLARLLSAGQRLTRARRLRLARSAGALQALSPLAVLERGYAVVTDERGRVVTRAAQADEGSDLDVRLHEGALRTRVVGRKP